MGIIHSAQKYDTSSAEYDNDEIQAEQRKFADYKSFWAD